MRACRCQNFTVKCLSSPSKGSGKNLEILHLVSTNNIAYLDDMFVYRNRERNLQARWPTWPTDLAMIPMPLTASTVCHNNNAFDDASCKDDDANEYEYDVINVQKPDDAHVAGAVGGDIAYEPPSNTHAFDGASRTSNSTANNGVQKTNDEYAYAYDNVLQPSAPDNDADDSDIDDYEHSDDYEPENSYEALPDDHEANPENPPPYDSLRPDSSP